MNNTEIFLLCFAIVSIFLIWLSIRPKKQEQPTFRTTESHECIPPEGARIGVVVENAFTYASADGISTLKTLHESLLSDHKALFRMETGLGVEEIIEKLRPSITPFVWEYHA